MKSCTVIDAVAAEYVTALQIFSKGRPILEKMTQKFVDELKGTALKSLPNCIRERLRANFIAQFTRSSLFSQEVQAFVYPIMVDWILARAEEIQANNPAARRVNTHGLS